MESITGPRVKTRGWCLHVPDVSNAWIWCERVLLNILPIELKHQLLPRLSKVEHVNMREWYELLSTLRKLCAAPLPAILPTTNYPIRVHSVQTICKPEDLQHFQGFFRVFISTQALNH